ncbi:MAG: carboxypeptidase-like regulatory domain-containing protein, partial [Hominilimicola sp.]
YAINISAVKAADKTVIDDAVIKVTSNGTEISPDESGNYMISEGSYVITASADGYRTAEKTLELTPALESKNVTIEMTSSTDLQNAEITVKYADKSGASIKEDTTPNGEYYVGDSYTVSSDLTADIIKNADGITSVYKIDKDKSQLSIDSLEAQNTITLVYALDGVYNLYEDFESYIVDSSKWTGSNTYVTVASENGDKYLSFASNGNTIGTYTAIDTISGEGKVFKVSADLKFAPTGTAGNSQFALSSSSPSFDGNNVNYGITGSSGNAAGHIIGIEYNKGAELLVNGTSVDAAFAGNWMHMEATVDFTTKKISVTLTNDSGKNAAVTDADFYSGENSGDNIGTFYLRAAKTNGTVGVDNLTIAELSE